MCQQGPAASELQSTDLPLQLHRFVLFDLLFYLGEKLHLVFFLLTSLPLER